MQLKGDLESFKCPYCQNVCLPEKNDDGVRVLNEPSGQECPLCFAPLMHAVLAKVPIVYCTSCQGTLVPMQALEGLVEQLREEHGAGTAPAAGDKDDLRRKINCPQCHRLMDAHFYAGPGNAVIDSCEECCLIWLDHGELMRIVHTPDTPVQADTGWDAPAEPAPGLGDAALNVITDLLL
jgi:Zn-finger nucleic acid-binding protein